MTPAYEAIPLDPEAYEREEAYGHLLVHLRGMKAPATWVLALPRGFQVQCGYVAYPNTAEDAAAKIAEFYNRLGYKTPPAIKRPPGTEG